MPYDRSGLYRLATGSGRGRVVLPWGLGGLWVGFGWGLAGVWVALWEGGQGCVHTQLIHYQFSSRLAALETGSAYHPFAEVRVHLRLPCIETPSRSGISCPECVPTRCRVRQFETSASRSACRRPRISSLGSPCVIDRVVDSKETNASASTDQHTAQWPVG